MLDNTENILLVIISDTHINSTVALCPLLINLDDGETRHASRTQHWLWECWLHFWQYTKDKANGRRIVGIINGDLGELDTKRRSNQLITPNKSIIKDICLEVLEPAIDVVDSWIFIRGTPAHEGKSAWLEEDIAKDIKTTVWFKKSIVEFIKGKPHNKGIASWWHLQGKVSDIRIDAAHHASMGGRPYNRGTSAIRLASDTLWHYRVERNLLAPDIVVRSHGHIFADSGENFDETRAFFTPCWSMITEFGYRTGRENDLPTIGGLLFNCNGHNYNWEKQLYETKGARRIWSLNL